MRLLQTSVFKCGVGSGRKTARGVSQSGLRRRCRAVPTPPRAASTGRAAEARATALVNQTQLF